MNVENFWRQLKHDYLHHVARPRLDTLVWFLIYKVTPSYFARSEILDDCYRMGRSKQLTTYQKYFKSSWKNLQKREISGKPYITKVNEWTCTCGRQKFDTHHLCKHLVQAVPDPPIYFWRQVIRRRILPIYRHPALIPKASDNACITNVGELEADGGNITDGDDHIWCGDKRTLEGGGGWRDTGFLAGNRLGGSTNRVGNLKRARAEHDGEIPVSGESQLQEDAREHKRIRTVECIDLTSSSPPREIATTEYEQVDEIPRSSSPIEYGSADENEVSFFKA